MIDILFIFSTCLPSLESNTDIKQFAESTIEYVDRKIQTMTDKEIKKLESLDNTLSNVLTSYFALTGKFKNK